ncbi:MAG: type II toxin-antitoxin system PemK/MazF family toxin [Candidatus Pacebacteria bacterium]|nr:type II toxin-antitoxin system PemK/MazF family toxin [Candidatus Paceibacterota bacterium]
MEKDFDLWNLEKQKIDKKILQDFYFSEREIWWCSIGTNIGVESNGKNSKFERPVLILNKFNGLMLWVLPLTTKDKTNSPHYTRIENPTVAWVSLTQIKCVSSLRLLRKICTLNNEDFSRINSSIIKLFLKSKTP